MLEKPISKKTIEKITAIGLGAAVMVMVSAWPAGAQTFDAETAENGIVRIVVYDDPQKCCAIGSGFVLNDQGFVGTNWHVVASPDSGGPYANGFVLASGSSKQYPFSVLWMDAELDLAILRVGGGFNRPKLPLTTQLPKKGPMFLRSAFPGGPIRGSAARLSTPRSRPVCSAAFTRARGRATPRLRFCSTAPIPTRATRAARCLTPAGASSASIPRRR